MWGELPIPLLDHDAHAAQVLDPGTHMPSLSPDPEPIQDFKPTPIGVLGPSKSHSAATTLSPVTGTVGPPKSTADATPPVAPKQGKKRPTAGGSASGA